MKVIAGDHVHQTPLGEMSLSTRLDTTQVELLTAACEARNVGPDTLMSFEIDDDGIGEIETLDDFLNGILDYREASNS